MDLQTHGAKKYPDSALLKSSAGLGWSTIAAELRSHGVSSTPVIVPQHTEVIPQESPHFERAKFRRFSAVRPDAERTNRLTRVLARDHRRSRIPPNSSRIEGIFGARPYP